MSTRKNLEENTANMELNVSTHQKEPPAQAEYGSETSSFEKKINDFFENHKRRLKTGRNVVLLLLYFAYYAYAMYCNYGDEGAVQLTVFTGFGLTFLSWTKLQKLGSFKKSWNAFRRNFYALYSVGNRRRAIRWFLYLVWSGLFVVYIVLNVVQKDAKNLRPLGGMAANLLILFLFSNNHRRINWHCVFYGIVLQCLFGLFVIRTSAGTTVLMWFSNRFTDFVNYSDSGAEFVFGKSYVEHPIAMKTAPSLLMLVAVVTILNYLGALQFVVRFIGTPLAYVLDVSSPEAVNAVANIFLGAIEACTTVLEYLPKLPASGLFCVLCNGMASCAGYTLILFMAFGVPLEYMLAASAMSAPAAIACAKIVYPDTEEINLEEDMSKDIIISVTNGTTNKQEALALQASEKGQNMKYTEEEKDSNKPLRGQETGDSGEPLSNTKITSDMIFPKPNNFGEAIVFGSKTGVKLIASLISLLIVSFTMVEVLNETVKWFGHRVNADVDLNLLLSYLFYPFAYTMGVDKEDCLKAGELLGLRTLAGPPIAYSFLGPIVRNREILSSYTSFVASSNETFTFDRTSDVILLPQWNMTLSGGALSERSEIIVTYALCGYSSVPTLNILFGVISTFAPERLQDITAVPFRLLVAGTLASYLTACVAGLLT